MDFTLTPDQTLFCETARSVAVTEFGPRVQQWEERDEFPWENLRRMGQLGFTGLPVPEEYGGVDATILDWVLVLEEIAKVDYRTAGALLKTTGAVCQAIKRFGTPEQKQRYLPQIARGDVLCAVGMTEPDAGSDLTHLRTNAIPDGNGGYLVNGQKCFVSEGDIADVYMVFLRFDGIPGSKGIGAFILEKGMPGFRSGRIDVKFFGGHEVELIFENCHLAASQLLLPAGNFTKLMSVWNIQRLGNAAVSLGIAEGAFEDTKQYLLDRKQFGRRIAEFQGVQWKIADMAVEIESCRLLLYRAALSAEAGVLSPLESSMAKLKANEVSQHVVHQGIQLFGCYGLSTEFPMERRYRRVAALTVGGGTSEILRNTIAAGVFKRRISQQDGGRFVGE